MTGAPILHIQVGSHTLAVTDPSISVYLGSDQNKVEEIAESRPDWTAIPLKYFPAKFGLSLEYVGDGQQKQWHVSIERPPTACVDTRGVRHQDRWDYGILQAGLNVISVGDEQIQLFVPPADALQLGAGLMKLQDESEEEALETYRQQIELAANISQKEIYGHHANFICKIWSILDGSQQLEQTECTVSVAFHPKTGAIIHFEWDRAINEHLQKKFPVASVLCKYPGFTLESVSLPSKEGPTYSREAREAIENLPLIWTNLIS